MKEIPDYYPPLFLIIFIFILVGELIDAGVIKWRNTQEHNKSQSTTHQKDIG